MHAATAALAAVHLADAAAGDGGQAAPPSAAASAAAPPPPPPHEPQDAALPVVAVHTVLRGSLGDGQYGRVTRGVLRIGAGPEQPTALKTFKSLSKQFGEYAASAAAVYRTREIEHLTRLPRHPHVLHASLVYENAQHWTCVAAPLAGGGSLQAALRRGAAAAAAAAAPPATTAGARPYLPPPAVVLTWTAHLLSGVAHLHAHGVLHRDIKLDNLLLDAHGRAVVGDLGQARILVGASAPLSHPPPSCGATAAAARQHDAPALTADAFAPCLRPPELLLLDSLVHWCSYGPEVDAWCLGMTLLALAHNEHYPLNVPSLVHAPSSALLEVFRLLGRPPPGTWPLLDYAAAPSTEPSLAALPPAARPRNAFAALPLGLRACGGGSAGRGGEFPPYASVASVSARAEHLRRFGGPPWLVAAGGRADLPANFWLTVAALLEVLPARRARVPDLVATPYWRSLLEDPVPPDVRALVPAAAAAPARGGRGVALGKQLLVPPDRVVAWGDAAAVDSRLRAAALRCAVERVGRALDAVAPCSRGARTPVGAAAPVRPPPAWVPATAAAALVHAVGRVHAVAARTSAGRANGALAAFPVPHCTGWDAAQLLGTAVRRLLDADVLAVPSAAAATAASPPSPYDDSVTTALTLAALHVAAQHSCAVPPPLTAWLDTQPSPPLSTPAFDKLCDAVAGAADGGVLYGARRAWTPRRDVPASVTDVRALLVRDSGR